MARRITHWREQAGLKKIKLAQILGVEPGSVSKWESGLASPSLINLHRFTEACEISLQIFWGRLPDVPESESEPELDPEPSQGAA